MLASNIQQAEVEKNISDHLITTRSKQDLFSSVDRLEANRLKQEKDCHYDIKYPHHSLYKIILYFTLFSLLSCFIFRIDTSFLQITRLMLIYCNVLTAGALLCYLALIYCFISYSRRHPSLLKLSSEQIFAICGFCGIGVFSVDILFANNNW